jgi:CBS domain-containing protein
MSKNVVTMDVAATAPEASRIMMKTGSGYLIVLEKARPVGIVTEADLVLKIMAKEREPSKVKASEVMSSPMVTVSPYASVQQAVSIMGKHRIRRLPVIHDNILEGVFTAQNLIRHFNTYEDTVLRNVLETVLVYPLGSDT